MKVAVNCRFLLKDKLTGLGHFTFELLKSMVRQQPDTEFIFIFDRPYHNDFIFADNITPVVLFPQARHPLLFIWWFEWSIPRLLKRLSADVFISPDNFMSLRTTVPTLLIIHDLAFEHYPKDVGKVNLWYYKYFMPRFARKARKIATVSNATKQDIIQQYGVSPSKIDVVHLGINQGLQRTNEERIPSIKQRFTSNCDFFIHIGTIQPRKNLGHLIQAFDLFRARATEPVKLVLVGAKGWKNSAIYDTYHASPYKEDIIFTGYVSNAEIADLLTAALGLVCVSYFEGFGMPVIEAQACGCPVIASNITSLPEVGGDAAYYIDPFSVPDIADALLRFHQDEPYRLALTKKGYKNQARFTWDRTAKLVWVGVEGMK